MRPWWQSDPERLQQEIDALEAAGFLVEKVSEAFAAGQAELKIVGGDPPIELQVVYPDFFPHFMPEVFAPSLSLTRHQDPVHKHLCLLGRSTSAWHVDDTLAGVLDTQLPRLLEFDPSIHVEVPTGADEQLAEPVSEYYNLQAPPGSWLLFDGDWRLDPEIESGTFVAVGQIVDDQGPVRTFQGYISEVRGAGRVLASWEGPVPSNLSNRFTGAWVRRPAPIMGSLNDFLAALSPAEKRILKNERSWPTTSHLQLGALIFPEEVRPGEFKEGWATLAWTVTRAQKGRARSASVRFVRTVRAGPSDLAARTPGVLGLASKSILIFGVGAVGAPLALALARAGVGRLMLVDPDTVDPATARRWPMGWAEIGTGKGRALQRRLAGDYPGTQVRTEEVKLGALNEPGTPLQRDLIEGLLKDCDLIIDATAEMGVAHFLSEIGRLRGIPFLTASGTHGIWGGMVAQFRPGRACWVCMRHALYVANSLPLAPADPQGSVQAAGCGEETFTGWGFDAEEISLEATRVAIGILGKGTAYPETTWDLGLLWLRHENGTRKPPCWTNHSIPARAGCRCQSR